MDFSQGIDFIEMMTKLNEIIPGITAGEDNDGQMILYTGLREVSQFTPGFETMSAGETMVIPMEDSHQIHSSKGEMT